MIVLSAGMPKAGTGWYFNLTNDLLVAAGCQDIREIRNKYHLHSVLKHENCNIEQLTLRKLALIIPLHLLGNTFVVKTHHGPSTSSRYLISSGIIRPTYIYRDPRDAAVSAFEHGQELRSKGQHHPFAGLLSIEDAIRFMKQQFVIWNEWIRLDSVLVIRYEDLVADPFGEIERLASFLTIDVSPEVLRQIVSSYQASHLLHPKRDVLHFNKGIVGRFKTVMGPEEQDLCWQHFGGYLRKMGYAK
jgi:hypothetical protein